VKGGRGGEGHSENWGKKGRREPTMLCLTLRGWAATSLRCVALLLSSINKAKTLGYVG